MAQQNVTKQKVTLSREAFDRIKHNKIENLILPKTHNFEAGFLHFECAPLDPQVVWIKDWVQTSIRGLSMKLNLSLEEIMEKIILTAPIDLSPESDVTYIEFLSPERTAHIFNAQKKEL